MTNTELNELLTILRTPIDFAPLRAKADAIKADLDAIGAELDTLEAELDSINKTANTLKNKLQNF